MRLSPLFHTKLFISFAGIFGASAILLGAWASHTLSGQEKNWIEIALRYQSIHGIALFILGVWHFLSEKQNHKLNRLTIWVGYLWLTGTLLFSGSLELLALTHITGLGSLTPIGGITMTLGWLCLILATIKLK